MTAPRAGITRLSVWVPGRPAPQGSKKQGQYGQMCEASPYLAAWAGSWTGRGKARKRAAGAIERAVYEQYRVLGVEPAMLPLFRGPVGVSIAFVMPDGRRVDGAPDGDKLTRAVWDALTYARVWEDDGRVVQWGGSKTAVREGSPTGASIVVWEIHP